MAMIRRFRVEGLAGRREECAAELNEYVNVCFGSNGSGKTSLLRILHSALSNRAELLKDVPFRRAEVVVYSFYKKIEYTYTLDKYPVAESGRLDSELEQLQSPLPRQKLKRKLAWIIDPPDGGAWHHTFLPTTRLYTLPKPLSALYGYTARPEQTEEQLETSFVETLTDTWRDYSAQLAQQTTEVQEEGLARILQSVISRSESSPDESDTNPKDAYKAVSQFLSRRNMSAASLTEKEFLQRYQSDVQLRSVSKDIEVIERRIAQLVAPRDTFKEVVNEMFLPGKQLKFGEKGIEVVVGDENINLATLSSGEKHLLRILVETIGMRAAPMLVDEPELSMHVDWQRRLISTMRILNRMSQMIFATHSPEIMAELPDSDIFRI